MSSGMPPCGHPHLVSGHCGRSDCQYRLQLCQRHRPGGKVAPDVPCTLLPVARMKVDDHGRLIASLTRGSVPRAEQLIALADWIGKGRPFTTASTRFRGSKPTELPPLADDATPASVNAYPLTDQDRSAWDYNREVIDYVIYSYDSPIAWHVDASGWYVRSARYSSTTTRHLNDVRSIVAVMKGQTQ